MTESPAIEARGFGDVVKFVATLKIAGRTFEAGYVQGVVEGGGRGLLGYILVHKRVGAPARPWNFWTSRVFFRERGIGSALLKAFEAEMVAKGVVELNGQLPDEPLETIERLKGWYEKRGYEVMLDPHSEGYPNRSAGRILKRIGSPRDP
jgi:GNAT superfamily N-acetyltransferase